MAVFNTIGSINVNSLSTTSGIFLGENVEQGWDSSAKTNTSISTTGHLNLAFNNLNLIIDPDLLDNPIADVNTNANPSPVILKGT